MKLHPFRVLIACTFGVVFVVLFGAAPTGAAKVPQSTATTVDWPSYGNDLANTRFQNLDQINPTNVAQLQPAWVFHTGVNDNKAMSSSRSTHPRGTSSGRQPSRTSVRAIR
jgi:hypothetical protein